MEEITIRYWSPHGRQEETKFQCEHTKIDLVMRAAQRVDLSGVARCSLLEKLDLSHNMLEELDLSPVSRCSSLKEINLQSNHLTELNLWPLKDCNRLTFIDVSENRLHGLDLTPVFLNTKIRMDSSVVVSADSVLRYVFTKEEIMKRFQLLRPDGANWAVPPVVIWKKYCEMKKQYDWAYLKERMISVLQKMSPIQWYGAQRGLLQGLGIAMIEGFDGDPRLLLDTTVSEMSFIEAQQAIFDSAVKLLEEQLQNDGPTLFLDIENMRETSASKLIPLIVEKREDEVEKSTLLVKGSTVFLRPLWLTHYGFNILSATGMGLTTNLEGLETLRKNFDELDLELRTQKVTVAKDVYDGTASKGMQKHVFDLIRAAFD
ncbi:leucine-rich repeat domain-containing protein [Candidatus Thorarchaeota archaeon]|nr:MAG: leucine-rich repeat domain-containing protein [Candidatus Thorarchaeota archaeon]